MTLSFSKPPKRVRHTQKKLPVYYDGQIINSIHLPRAESARSHLLQSVSSAIMLPRGVQLLRMKGKPRIECITDKNMTPSPEMTGAEDDAHDWEDSAGDNADLFEVQEHQFVHTDTTRLLGQDKAKISREKQRRRWRDDLLPRLLPQYIAYLSLRQLPDFNKHMDGPAQCQCSEHRILSVTILRWNELDKASITVCQCNPAAEQLLKQGLFPCSPIRPSVAADIHLLELIITSFLHLSPNMTGWADLLVDFWSAHGFHLKAKTSLRRQLSSCLVQYQQLQQLHRRHLHELLAPHRSSNMPKATNADAVLIFDVADTVSTPRLPIPRPSETLRSKCPLCFGGAQPDLVNSSVHAIVCLDACFSQKRRKSKHLDELHIIESTFFISPDQIDEMERKVTHQRTRKPKASLSDPVSPPSTVLVPNEVLDDCERSFLAAQESNTKAATNFFADTGLMALLCRHDRVLFLANVVTAGEKQHYALALLDALFKEIPSTWRLGVLYDIGCQLHRSCEKYNLLSEYQARITWSISVFHAYGHQWACQLIYHPRKRKDFGYSDGEGCERFWSSISQLVAPLRVSGYYRRLFCLDVQVQHNMSENLKAIGRWLLRKVSLVASRRLNARKQLATSGLPMEMLRREWNSQVQSQTRIQPRYSPKAAAYAVGKVILLRSELADAEDGLDVLKECLIDADDNQEDLIAEAEGNIATLKAKVRTAERTLGTGLAQTTLEATKKNKYLECRLKALATKRRLLVRLQARKFEFSKLNQHAGRPVLGNKLYTHTKSAIQRREAGIKSLALAFNRLVDTMSHLRTTCDQYRDEKPPEKVRTDQLFRLDVFSNIWEDDGLLLDLPLEERWRTEQCVREGIHVLLELDRCTEEEERLRSEAQALVDWVVEEIDIVEKALNATALVDKPTQHMLVSQISFLHYLVIGWSKSMKDLFTTGDWLTFAIERLDRLPHLPVRFYGAGHGEHAGDDTSESDSNASEDENDMEPRQEEELIAMEESEDEDIEMHRRGLL